VPAVNAVGLPWENETKAMKLNVRTKIGLRVKILFIVV
jgi:hypothetical protein